MSLTRRKARPIKRETNSLRDDRLFLIACDDTYAPLQYFGFFQLARIQVHVVPTNDGTSVAKNVLNRLRQFEIEPHDERWLLLDTDHCTSGTHLAGFSEALQEARQAGIQVALSKPSFELWLLLHHCEETAVAGLQDAKAVEKALRNALGSYNKTKLDPSAFPLPSVSTACRRALLLDATVPGGDIPAGNTSRVYKLWQAIAAKAHPTQLPEQLRTLRAPAESNPPAE
jgi:hypothetical protein